MLMRKTSKPLSGADIFVESVVVCEKSRECVVSWSGVREGIRSIVGAGASLDGAGVLQLGQQVAGSSEQRSKRNERNERVKNGGGCMYSRIVMLSSAANCAPTFCATALCCFCTISCPDCHSGYIRAPTRPSHCTSPHHEPKLYCLLSAVHPFLRCQ
jgi:hypothetical protein